eukprot:7385638-Prymnesium_polylepis.1
MRSGARDPIALAHAFLQAPPDSTTHTATLYAPTACPRLQCGYWTLLGSLPRRCGAVGPFPTLVALAFARPPFARCMRLRTSPTLGCGAANHTHDGGLGEGDHQGCTGHASLTTPLNSCL